jgi:hypothetical protein
MHIIRNTLKSWLPLAVAFSALIGLIYLSVQQVYRSNANDPQVQMAEDAAVALADGQPAQSLVSPEKVDIARSLAPYLVVFDSAGKPVASSALLDGQVPTLPAGVIEYARQHGEDRITWQPQPGVRGAAVVVAARGGQAGFVLAGRSLREVENRVAQLGVPFAGAWFLAMVAALGLIGLFEALRW